MAEMAEKLEQSSEPVRDAVARRKSADKTDRVLDASGLAFWRRLLGSRIKTHKVPNSPSCSAGFRHSQVDDDSSAVADHYCYCPGLIRASPHQPGFALGRLSLSLSCSPSLSLSPRTPARINLLTNLN